MKAVTRHQRLTVRQYLSLTAVATVFAGVVVVAEAAVLWTEDFSDVSGWRVISDPGGGSEVASNGSSGMLFVQSAHNLAAFGPKPVNSRMIPFDPARKENYSLTVNVSDLSSSVSYDIALDQFDVSRNYVGTVWQVFPSTSTSTFTGSTNVSLGNLCYETNTAYLLPKITVHTGEGRQTVTFKKLEFNVSSMQPRSSP